MLASINFFSTIILDKVRKAKHLYFLLFITITVLGS